ncbi:hypothetical protein D4S03_04380 [bacterium]|nr:MAG: hypothetical protein D4S03_04380 [bacterium]
MPYFKFIKSNCANYIPVGPYQKKDYCLLCAAPFDDYQCLVKQGKECAYFLSAVLLWDKNLKRQWQDEQKSKTKSIKVKSTKVTPFGYGVCECGAEFERQTNRQKRCEKCIKKSNRLSASARQRKLRANKVSGITPLDL